MSWSYLSHVRTCRNFRLEADKGGKTGGSNSAPTVAELTTKVTDLEAQKVKADADLKAATELGEKAEADLKTERAKSEKLEADLKLANEKTTKLETDLKSEQEKSTKLDVDLKAANDKSTKAEADLKAADERAEQRLREIDARNGGTVPNKKPGAGDHTTTQEPDASETPQNRLAALINSKR